MKDESIASTMSILKWVAAGVFLGTLFSVVRYVHAQSASPHGVFVSWVASPTTGITAYNVFRAPSTSGTCGTYAQVGTVGNTLSWLDDQSADTTLKTSTAYCYDVQAAVGTNLSALSGTPATVTTPAAWPTNPAPPAAGGCKATVQ
jgi:hypothetical protein